MAEEGTTILTGAAQAAARGELHGDIHANTAARDAALGVVPEVSKEDVEPECPSEPEVGTEVEPEAESEPERPVLDPEPPAFDGLTDDIVANTVARDAAILAGHIEPASASGPAKAD